MYVYVLNLRTPQALQYVLTLIGLLIFIVAIALPAYIGRLKVFSSTTSRTSIIGAESNKAASLGK